MEGSIDGIIVNEIISYKWDHTGRACKIKMLLFFLQMKKKKRGEVEGTWYNMFLTQESFLEDSSNVKKTI